MKTSNLVNIKNNKDDFKFTIVWLTFICQAIGLILVLVNQGEDVSTKLFLLCLAFIVVSFLTNMYLPKLSKGDNNLIYIVNMIFTIGLLQIIRLSTATGQAHVTWYLLAVGISTLVLFILKKFGEIFENKFFFYFSITLITFILTLTLGSEYNGAKNWIYITESLTIQPSEFAKISFVFMVASFYGDYEKIKKYKYGKFYLNVAVYLFIALFFLQGELGTAMVFFATFILTMYVFESNYKLLILNILLAAMGLFFAYILFSHIRVRFDIWRDPWADYYGAGYQIVQSLFAIASGGLFGTGLGLGSPNIIPVAVSDFIVPAVIEEMGVFMGISLVLLYIILVYKGIKSALTNKNIFYSVLAFCVTIIFASQSLVMFGGVLKIIPLTGITTPFMSYGGSSTLSNFILLAVLQLASSKKGGPNEQ